MKIQAHYDFGLATLLSSRRLRHSLALAVALLLGGCHKAPPAEKQTSLPPAKPRVLVVNYPLFYFAQRLGGEAFTVEFPMKEAGDPAFWEPDVATLSTYQKADLIVLNGAGFGTWIEKVSLPERKLLDAGAAFKGELLSSGEVVTHSHGMQGAHTHPGIAFTTWLDSRFAMLQATAIAKALVTLSPADEATIGRRLIDLKTDWDAWAQEFSAVVSTDRQRPVIASHPVYQYLIRAGGGLNWRSLHWEPDETPTPEQWSALASLAKDHPAKWMVWESEPLPAVREKLAKEFGIACVVFDPCGNRPTHGDLLSTLRANLEALRKVYSAEAKR